MPNNSDIAISHPYSVQINLCDTAWYICALNSKLENKICKISSLSRKYYLEILFSSVVVHEIGLGLETGLETTF